MDSGLALGYLGSIADFAADGNAGYGQLLSTAAVALDQDADGVIAALAGRGADAAFKSVADHTGASADGAFFDPAAVGAVEGGDDVLGLDVEAVDVVQESVVGFGDNRQGPGLLAVIRDFPLDECVADDADAVGVGDHHRAEEEAGFL